MSATVHTHFLHGCSPTPLANYLKAIGLFRILAEQHPASHPQAHWQGNTFVLTTTLDASALRDFFLTRYQPTPIIAPWNGGSGFFPKDNATALNAILASAALRFAPYRDTITTARATLDSLGLREKPDGADAKEALLLRCRNTFSETALVWLDAAFVLTGDGAKYPPLLGTGGNDGRLEFTNNFMQRLTEVFDVATGTPAPSTSAFLAAALFDTPVSGLADNPIGQFSPASAGGANATTGFDAKCSLNPWDFILALEGAMLFAAAAVKRLESSGTDQLAYPFCVRASGAGYGSADTADEADSRCEIWMPLWSQPASLAEIQTLFAEGRAWVGRRPAKNGIDFALAATSLGVDRGIAEFQRYAFHVRNGLAYFAIPLQRIRVTRNPVSTDLIATCDAWLQRFLPKAKADTAPGSIRRAARRLENAVFAQVTAPRATDTGTADATDTAPVQELLAALGQCEHALATSAKWRADSFVPPVPPLQRAWVKAADDHSIEFRLAASLASLTLWARNTFYPIRRHLAPVKVYHGESSEKTSWAAWDDTAENDLVSTHPPLPQILCAITRRRLLLNNANSAESWLEFAKLTAYPGDIAAFIAGQTDDARLLELLRGLALVDFSAESEGSNMPRQPADAAHATSPPALYAQLKLCFATELPDEKKIPLEPNIFHLAAAGDGTRASAQALRRLHASNIPITHIHIPLEGPAAQRIAAALLFPLWRSQLAAVGRIVAPDFFPFTTGV